MQDYLHTSGFFAALVALWLAQRFVRRNPSRVGLPMKRAVRFAADLVGGACLGFLVGIPVYVVVFAVYGSATHDMKHGQVVGFVTAMAFIPLVALIKVAHGQYTLRTSDESKPPG